MPLNRTITPQQATAGTIRLPAPAVDEVITIQNAAGLKLALDFAPDAATTEKAGNDLVFTFPEGGQVVVADFFVQLEGGNVPTFVIEGQELPGDAFLTAFNAELLPAAGPGAGGGAGSGGVGDYTDDPGSLVDSVDRLGTLDPLAFERGIEPIPLTDAGLVDNGVTITNITPGGPDIGAGEGIVDETALADGTAPDAAGRTLTGDFTITAPDGLDTVVIGGETVIAGGVLVDDSVAGTYGTLTITGYDPATGVITYSYELTGNADHTAGDETIFETFPITATDTDGDLASDSLNIQILDDVPVIIGGRAEVDETDFREGNTSGDDTPLLVSDTGDNPNDPWGDGTIQTQGTLNFSAGADRVQSLVFDAAIESNGPTLTSQGAQVRFDVSDDGKELRGYIAAEGEDANPNGLTVFTMTIDNNGKYTYTQERPLDHSVDGDALPGDPASTNHPHNDALQFNVGVVLTDTDTDTATGNITVVVRDDGPRVYGSEEFIERGEYPTDGEAPYVVDADDALTHSFNFTSGSTLANLISASTDANTGFVDIRMDGGTPYNGGTNGLGGTYDGKKVVAADGPDRENELGYRDDKESHEQEALVFKLNGVADHFTMDASGALIGIGDIGESGLVQFFLGGQPVGSLSITHSTAGSLEFNGLFDRVVVTATDRTWFSTPDNSDFFIKNVSFQEADASNVNIHTGELSFNYGADRPGSFELVFDGIAAGQQPEAESVEVRAAAPSDAADVADASIWTVDGRRVSIELAQDAEGKPIAGTMVGHIINDDGTDSGQVAFTLTVNTATGEWTLAQRVPLDLPENGGKLGFSYTITDTDGDTATGHFTVTVNEADRAPDIDMRPVAHVVDENGLVAGNDATRAAVKDTFRIDANGEDITGVTIAGKTFSLEDLQGASLAKPLVLNIGMNGKDVTVDGYYGVPSHATLEIIGVSGDATSGYSVQYRYTLKDNVEHSSRVGNIITGHETVDDMKTGDVIPVSVTTTGADGHAQSASASLTVTIVDDTPTIDLAPAAGPVTEGQSIAGTWTHAMGADNDSGSSIRVVINGNEYGINQNISTSKGILRVNDNGEWTFAAKNNLDHDYKQELKFALRITDSDGDSKLSDTITVAINDGEGPARAGTLTLTLDDDAASRHAHPDGYRETDKTSGDLSFTAGSDNIKSFSFVDASDVKMEGAGAALTWAVEYGKLVGRDSNGNTAVILSLSGGDIDAGKTGNVTVHAELIDPLLHASNSDIVTIKGIKVRGTDIDGNYVDGSVTLKVTDDMPVAKMDADWVREDGTLIASGNVLSNDTDSGYDLSADGNRVTHIAKGDGTPTDVSESSSTVIQGEYGTLTIYAGGGYSYSLNNADPRVQHLNAETETLTDTFKYTVTDGDGDKSKAPLVITIEGTDDGVFIRGLEGSEGELHEKYLPGGTAEGLGSLVTAEREFTIDAKDGLGSLTMSYGGQTVAIVEGAVLNTPYGNLTIIGFDATTGKVTYTFKLDNNAPHTTPGTNGEKFDLDITVTLTDRDGDSTSAKINIDIKDDVPHAKDLTADVTEDGGSAMEATVNLLGAGVTGADGGLISSIVQGKYGKLAQSDGTYKYVLNNADHDVQALNSGQTMQDTITYTVTDGDGDKSTATLTVTIRGTDDFVNHPPTAVADAVTIHEDDVNAAGKVTGSLFTNVLNNDTDPDTGQTLVVTNSGDHTNSNGYGTLHLKADGSYTYDINMNNAAVKALFESTTQTDNKLTDSFSYTVSDGHGGTSTATLTIDIVPDRLITGTSGNDTVPTSGLGNDVVVGDPGGTFATTVFPAYNVVVVMDSSGSMEGEMAEAKEALLKLIDKYAGYKGDVNFHLVDFDKAARLDSTFNLETAKGIADAKAAVKGMKADGGTNYEAGLNAATEWLTSVQNSGGKNVVYFVTDGDPTFYYKDTVSYTHTYWSWDDWSFHKANYQIDIPPTYQLGDIVTNAAVDARINTDGYLEYLHDGSWGTSDKWVLGGNGKSTNTTEINQSHAAYDRLLSALSGNVAVNTIGIKVGKSGPRQSALNYYDNTNGAQIITDAAQLGVALDNGSVDVNPAATGKDTLHGGAGNDIIFGDAINADYLLTLNTWNHGQLHAGDSLNIINSYLTQTLGHPPSNDELRHFIEANHNQLAPLGDVRGSDDFLYGDAGDDVLYGQGGNDTLYGGAGNDTLHGGTGNDFLYGGDGDDMLYGDAGNDVLDGGMGVNYLDGGTGNDILRIQDTSGDHRITDADFQGLHGGAGTDTLVIHGDNVVLDFTNIANGKVSGIETIDLATDTGAQTVRLTAADLFDLAGTSDASTAGEHKAVHISGDTADKVELVGGDWTHSMNASRQDVYSVTVGTETRDLIIDHTIQQHIINSGG